MPLPWRYRWRVQATAKTFTLDSSFSTFNSWCALIGLNVPDSWQNIIQLSAARRGREASVGRAKTSVAMVVIQIRIVCLIESNTSAQMIAKTICQKEENELIP